MRCDYRLHPLRMPLPLKREFRSENAQPPTRRGASKLYSEEVFLRLCMSVCLQLCVCVCVLKSSAQRSLRPSFRFSCLDPFLPLSLLASLLKLLSVSPSSSSTESCCASYTSCQYPFLIIIIIANKAFPPFPPSPFPLSPPLSPPLLLLQDKKSKKSKDKKKKKAKSSSGSSSSSSS